MSHVVRTTFCALSIVVFCLSAQTSARGAETPAGVPYTVEVTGEPSGDVSDLIKRASQLMALRDRPPPSLAALGRRIRDDEDRVRAILESEGYYNATVVTRMDENENGGTTKVTVTIEAGKRYTLRELNLELGPRAADETQPVLRTRAYLGPAENLIGKAARAETIIAAEDAAIAALRVGGFAFARRGDRDVKVDHEAGEITVTLPVHLGPNVVFGDVNVRGETKVGRSFVDGLVSWRQGDRYDSSRLERLRIDLITAGLYSSVRVEPAGTDQMPDGAPLDIDVIVQDALHRTFGAGAKFARDKGLGATLFWEHRNIIGGGEKLNAALDATEIDQKTNVTFTKPGVWSPKQTLKIVNQLTHSDTDAYEEWGAVTTAALERKLSDTWTVSGGVSLDIADINEDGTSRRSYLAGLPVTATWTTTNPLTPLDPVKGWRIALAATPFGGAFAGSVAFFKSEAQASVYVPMDSQFRTIIAARVKAGSIVGTGTDRVPANRRFYAGGGGSIRGYAYQLAGPLAADNTPTGGRSVIEGSLEVRYRVTDTIGVVPFMDAGMASRSSIPGTNSTILTAAGLGVRYYTPVGPLRVDVAMPLNRRPGVDKGFQFYISFGQAF